MPALILALACSAALVAVGDLRGDAWTAMGVLLAWGLLAWGLHGLDLQRTRRGLPTRLDVRQLSPGTVFLAAAAVRLPLVLTEPGLSDDVYRYAWEGWLTLHGGNPYAVAPAAWDPALHAGLDHPVRALVNHPEVSTIYPPVAMWGFALLAGLADALAPADPRAMAAAFQGATALADAGIAAALAGALRADRRGTAPAWLYAVLPLGAVEAAHGAHLEAWGVLCLVLAVWAWRRGGSGLGFAALGALVKLVPGALIPVLWRRRPWLLLLAAGLFAVALLPFRDAGPALLRGFSTYAEHWSFHDSGFAVISHAVGLFSDDPRHARAVAVAVGVAVSAAAWLRLRDPARVALWIGAAFVLLSPTVHPWYLLWAWVPALLCGVRAFTVLAVLAPVSYAALASYDPASGRWEEPWWPVWIHMLPFLAALLAEWAWHATRPGPWAPSPAPRAAPSVSRTSTESSSSPSRT